VYIRFVQKKKMQILIKIIISLIVIVAATKIGKRLPSAAGLIGVMPLTGTLVVVFGAMTAFSMAKRGAFRNIDSKGKAANVLPRAAKRYR
jgi:hypothetical protein